MKKKRPLRKYGVKSSDITVMAATKVDALSRFVEVGLVVTWPMIFEIESPGVPLSRRGHARSKKKPEP